MSKMSLGVQKAAHSAVVLAGPSPFDFAAIANREHALARQSGESMIEHAILAGEALLKAKAKEKHGDWLPWLEANFDGSERIAQMYMSVAANPKRVADLEDPSLRKALAAINGETAHVGHNSGDNEWFTPRDIIAAATRAMGGIDLDPASNAVANEVVGAERFFSEEEDGREQPWQGRVWMNPPYAQPLIGEFCAKFAQEVSYGNVTSSCVLVNNATETEWFQSLSAVASAVCFPSGRLHFWQPGRESSTPLQGQAILYFGTDAESFRREFASFGQVWRRWEP